MVASVSIPFKRESGFKRADLGSRSRWEGVPFQFPSNGKVDSNDKGDLG